MPPETEVVDRGDAFTPSAEDVAAAAQVKVDADAAAATQAAADLETASGKKPETAAVEETKTDDQDDKARDDKGRFIPASRHKDVLENERAKREAVERQLAELQTQLKAQTVSKTEGEMQAQIVELRTQKAKATLDGDTDKIVALETQIDSIRDQIAVQKSSEMTDRAKAEAREEIRMDSAIDSLKKAYPALDDGGDEFDQALVDDVLGWQAVFMQRDRMAPSAALVEAAKKVMTVQSTSEPEPEAKGLSAAKGNKAADRKEAATKKNIDAALKTPPDTKDVGIDTDKAGMKDGLPTPLTVAELAALPEATIKRMRGDSI